MAATGAGVAGFEVGSAGVGGTGGSGRSKICDVGIGVTSDGGAGVDEVGRVDGAIVGISSAGVGIGGAGADGAIVAGIGAGLNGVVSNVSSSTSLSSKADGASVGGADVKDASSKLTGVGATV